MSQTTQVLEYKCPCCDAGLVFGQDVQQVTLGFVPGDKSGWECRELREEDSTFFVKGPVFESFAEKKLRIPSLSHA